jgi:hypothetical protein
VLRTAQSSNRAAQSPNRILQSPNRVVQPAGHIAQSPDRVVQWSLRAAVSIGIVICCSAELGIRSLDRFRMR